jgi:hypothetical protein
VEQSGPVRVATASRCPACGGQGLRAVPRPPNLLCDRCGACWQPVDGGLRRIDPLQCPGCSFRRVCVAALAERSP